VREMPMVRECSGVYRQVIATRLTDGARNADGARMLGGLQTGHR
jgi:hypothetical protein